MGQRIELIKELGILSADVKWFHGMDPDGKPCNIKSRFKASEKLNALLYRESEIKTFLDVDSVITASRTFLDGEYTLSLFPVLDGFALGAVQNLLRLAQFGHGGDLGGQQAGHAVFSLDVP